MRTDEEDDNELESHRLMATKAVVEREVHNEAKTLAVIGTKSLGQKGVRMKISHPPIYTLNLCISTAFI